MREKPATGREEQAFFTRFGYGFGSLLDSWREWVNAQGVGSHDPPPMWVRDELLERIVPTIRDLKAKRRDRVDAIRGWGSAGYVLRADALIELLHVREGGLKAEAIGSLDAVSGMPSGDEPDRWRAWCEGLPAGLTEMCEERTGALRL